MPGMSPQNSIRLDTLHDTFDVQRPQVAAGLDHSGANGRGGTNSGRQALIDALKLTGLGNQAALRHVYAASSVKLFGIILRILGGRDLAEDVLQEVYIHVWQHARDFDPATSSPINWLVTIARNRALDETRRKTTRSMDDCPELFHVSKGEDHLADQERREDHHRLLACLDRLGPEKRTAVMLAYHYGMTRQEIARSTDRPTAAVKTWLRHNLAQIKDCLGQ
jgi:RNA polymerase sigma-70 factor, ECF subfamily